MLRKLDRGLFNAGSPSLSSIFRKSSTEVIPSENRAAREILFPTVIDQNLSESSSNSGEISSTLSGIDDDFWSSKVPTCCICFDTKIDLPKETQWCACKEKKGHFFCDPCFMRWRVTNFETNVSRREDDEFALPLPVKCPYCKDPVRQTQE